MQQNVISEIFPTSLNRSQLCVMNFFNYPEITLIYWLAGL